MYVMVPVYHYMVVFSKWRGLDEINEEIGFVVTDSVCSGMYD